MIARKRILFVDDEVAILDALANLLRKDRGRWDMVFAPGPDSALAELARAPFDVVVSDMRMPRMDGAALLTHVGREHPATARIVLSGHAEREALLRTFPIAHQVLSKPCDPHLLRSTLARTCDLQDLLADEGVRRAIGAMKFLPPVPQTYLDLNRAASRSDVAINDIARIVEADPAMSIRLLQLVNSAYFGLARRVTSIQHAVGLLGIEMVRGLALTARVFHEVEGTVIPGVSPDDFQVHALRTARLARKLVSGPAAEEAFTAALVHDIGRLVLALYLPERHAEVAVRSDTEPSCDVEREVVGANHAQIGAYLLGVWGLPLAIVEVVAHHHAPSDAGSGGRVLAAVHVADHLLEGGCGHPLDLGFLDRSGLSGELPSWRTLAAAELRHGDPA